MQSVSFIEFAETLTDHLLFLPFVLDVLLKVGKAVREGQAIQNYGGPLRSGQNIVWCAWLVHACTRSEVFSLDYVLKGK